eukprot:jgi/Ulvmu1/11994/UM083_0004.1
MYPSVSSQCLFIFKSTTICSWNRVASLVVDVNVHNWLARRITNHMAVPGLTRDNVASHLQKHRMHVKKTKEPRAVDSHHRGNSPCATVSGTDDVHPPVQRCSMDGPTVNTNSEREQDLATLESSEKCGNPCASNLHTSDSASGRTAFTLAVRSGVNSTPDSRETGNGVVVDTSGAGSNMASSAQLQRNGSRSAGTANGVSRVEGSGDPSSWGGYVAAAGSAAARPLPPQATATSAVPQAAIGNSLVVVTTDKSEQLLDACAVPPNGMPGPEPTPAAAEAPHATVSPSAVGNRSAAEQEPASEHL